jgi:peptidoglycan/LPS O-acetylase OafA/YrhL
VDLGNYFLAAHIIYFAGGILAYFAWLRVRHLRGVGLALLVAGIVSFVAMLAFRSQMARMGFAGATRLGQTVPLMLFVMGMAISPVSLLVNRFTTMMGETSFSLYLFHPALIGILMTGGFYKWIYKTVPDAGMAYAVCALATLAILFPAAFLGFKYIEVPGNRLGARLIAWLDRRNREPSRSEPGGQAERQATI